MRHELTPADSKNILELEFSLCLTSEDLWSGLGFTGSWGHFLCSRMGIAFEVRKTWIQFFPLSVTSWCDFRKYYLDSQVISCLEKSLWAQGFEGVYFECLIGYQAMPFFSLWPPSMHQAAGTGGVDVTLMACLLCNILAWTKPLSLLKCTRQLECSFLFQISSLSLELRVLLHIAVNLAAQAKVSWTT